MKNLLTKFCVAALAVLFCGIITGCEVEEGVGDFSVSVKEVGADYANLYITAPYAMEMAYMVTTEPSLVTPALLFKNGTVLTVNPADIIEIKKGIQQDTQYYLYAVGKLDESNYTEKVSLEFKTKKYEFNELLKVVETYPDGFKVHITFPEATRERGNVIRFGTTSLAWYNLLKTSNGDEAIDVNAVVANGNPYGNYIVADSTVVFDNQNVVLLDKNGEPLYDENGDTYDIHDPIAPGEPTIFLAGECRYGTPEEYNQVMGFYAPDKPGHYVPLYEWGKGWYGEFQKIIFKTQEPTVSEAKVNVVIPEDEIGITDAMVYFEKDKDIVSYFYMILDDATYNQILSTYLDGNEDWFQWFLTSYIAFYEWGVYGYGESMAVNAASSFVEPLTGGKKYHVLVTAMADAEGTKQHFVHETFHAKEKTKGSPVINVTALETGNPYEASFNIKAPGKDLAGAYWACNYSREFEKMFNLKYTYADLLYGNYTLTAEEVAAVNSDKGLTVSFPSLDGETTRFAIYGCNDEYTFNKLDPAVEGTGWADCTTPMCEPDAPISSPLFEALEGEWTATATIVAKEAVEGTDDYVSYNVEHKSKVTISRSAPALPETLPAEVYELYKSLGVGEVDGMFEELKDRSQTFTEYRLEGQNRLLCNGFIDFDYYADNGRLKYYSPYDLFVATNYSSVDVPQIMYDFGPKWFLEVLEDGSVIVPMDSDFLPPMHSWPGYPFYVAAVTGGYAVTSGNDQIPGFPVEVSEDMNKITIKPIMISDGASNFPAYMNAVGLADGSYELVATIVSEVVLTRGWTETKAMNYVTAMPSKATAVTLDGQPAALPIVTLHKSMTDLSVPSWKDVEKTEKANVVTMDMVKETSDKILKHYNLK